MSLQDPNSLRREIKDIKTTLVNQELCVEIKIPVTECGYSLNSTGEASRIGRGSISCLASRARHD